MNGGYSMKKLILPISIFLLIIFVQISLAKKELKRRGFVGLGYRAITQADIDSLKLPDGKGLMVNRVLSNTPADRAGIKVGDILKKYDENIILDQSQFLTILRKYFAGDTIKISLLRNGKLKTVNLIMEALPEEKSDEIDIQYTSFPTGGIYLRAVVTSPLKSQNKKLPALLIVSALHSPQLIGASFYSLHRELAYAVTKAGFRVMRFELRGYGDSEGEDYRTTDFNTEVEDNLAGLDYLMNRDDVDKDNVFVFGISTGGQVAAILASKREIRGLITSNTIGRTFYERMVETLRLQGKFSGDSYSEIDQTIKNYLNLTVSVAHGDSLNSILQRSPELSSLVNQNSRIMDDRTVAYWRQQLNLNLSDIYNKITEPVLVLYAESDFITQIACHEHIRDVLTTAGNKDVTLTVIPICDHAFSYVRDKKESFENYKTRNFKFNAEPARQITEWLIARVIK
jgi:alpha-beta hydrolase superfamily lysophospholipase